MVVKRDSLMFRNTNAAVFQHHDTQVEAPVVMAQRPMTDCTAWAIRPSIENF